MKLSPYIQYLRDRGLLTTEEKETIFFADDAVPEPIKKLARDLKAELARRKPATK